MRAGLRGTLALCAVLAACGTRPARDPDFADAERAAVARTINETAARVAVSKVGAKVCRAVTVGISERDWIRGVVVEVASDKIRVKVDDQGRFPQTLDGVFVARGIVLWDTPLNWKPCL